MDQKNLIIELRRRVNALETQQNVFVDVEPRSPKTNTVWVRADGTTKYWDGSNWVIGGGGALTDWNTTVAFTASDYRTIAWSTGVVSIGTRDSKIDYATTSGNFTMTQTTYFYWQADNPTAIQTATVAGDVVIAGGVLLAVGRLNPDTANKASLKAFGGPTVDQIIADEIVANSITANMIQANSITSAKLATTLLYAGAITLDTNGLIKGGQTAYNTGTGFFLGYSTSAYKLSMGNGSTKAFTYDGTDLTITGGIIQTGTSGQRVVISGSIIESYDASGVSRWKTNANGFRLVNSAATLNTDVTGDSLGSSAAMKVAGAIKCDGLIDTGTGMNIYTNGGQITFQGYAGSGNGITLSSTLDNILVLSGDTITLAGKNLYSDGTDLYWNGVKIN